MAHPTQSLGLYAHTEQCYDVLTVGLAVPCSSRLITEPLAE